MIRKCLILFVIFLVVLPIIFFPTSVYADDGKPGFLTKMVEGAFEFLFKKLIEPFLGFTDPFNLIYDPDKKLYFKIFTVQEWNNIIVRGGNMVVSLAYLVIFVGVLNVIYHLNQSSINPHNRAAFFELGAALLLVSMLLRHLQDIYEIMLKLNYSIVSIFHLDLTVTGAPSVTEMHDGIGGIFLYMIYLGLSWWANFYYIMRKFTLISLFILGALFITFFLFQKTKPIAGAWFRETFANVMVQSIHGVTFWIYLQMDTSTHAGLSGLIEKCILLAVFIPISEGLKHLFNMATGSTDKSSFMAMATGTAGLAGIYSAGRAALGKETPIDGISSRFMGSRKDGMDSSINGGGMSGQASLSSQAPMSAKTNRMLQVGRIFSNLGKGAGTLMGTSFGMSMGPAGVIGAASVAGEFGRGTGALVGRTGMAAYHGANTLKNNVSQSISDELRNKDESLSRDSLYRNSGLPEGMATSYTNSLVSVASGTRKGIVNTFRGREGESISDARSRKMNLAGYVGGVIKGEEGVQSFSLKAGQKFDKRNPQAGQEFSDLSKANVQKVRVAITKEHSYMVGDFRDNNGNNVERRIGNYGGGDPSLKKDEVFFKDYHIQDGRFVSGNGEVPKMSAIGTNHTATPIQRTTYHLNETYQLDSKGSKVITNKDYKVNPYDYLPRQESSSVEKYFHPQRMKQGIV